MKKTHGWLFMSLFMLGCTSRVEEAAGDGPLGSVQGAVTAYNAVDPNAVDPNAVDPNAVDPAALDLAALDPASLSPSSMAALQAPGEDGRLSRMLVRYLVNCAFDATQSFSFTWSNSEGLHPEQYWGSMALVPDWGSRGLTLTEQRWVSACIAARVNYYGVTVLISLRGVHPALGIEEGERDTYSIQEGAFWGNLFEEEPDLKSCYFPAGVSAAREEGRYCAARLWDDETECHNIDIIGPCTPGTCVLREDEPGDGYITCDGDAEVITTFINPN